MPNLDELISAAFSVDGASLSDGDNPDTVGGWDSIAQLVLLTSIEDAYGFQFTDDEMSSIDTIGDVRRLVASKVGVS